MKYPFYSTPYPSLPSPLGPSCAALLSACRARGIHTYRAVLPCSALPRPVLFGAQHAKTQTPHPSIRTSQRIPRVSHHYIPASRQMEYAHTVYTHTRGHHTDHTNHTTLKAKQSKASIEPSLHSFSTAITPSSQHLGTSQNETIERNVHAATVPLPFPLPPQSCHPQTTRRAHYFIHVRM